MLSAIVITKNEQEMITGCLDSLTFADEIIVVDTGNTDSTNQIAKKYHAKIVKNSGTDFSQFREAGLHQAKGDWILYLDADERISPPLKSEILSVISTAPESAFALPRTNIYLGIAMRFGGWGGDYVVRLFKRSHVSGWKNPLHEQPILSVPIIKLTQPVIHYSHRNLFSMTEKTIQFTDYEAKLRQKSHHPPVVVWRMVRVILTEFWHRFIKLSAWRDGTEGVIDGLFQVFNTFIIYSRLWELQNESRHQ